MSYHGIITKIDPSKPSFNNPVSTTLFTGDDLIESCILLYIYATQRIDAEIVSYTIEYYKDIADLDEYDSYNNLNPTSVYYFDKNFNCFDIYDNTTALWSPCEVPK